MSNGPQLEQMRPSGNGRSRGLVSSRVSGARVHARMFAPSEDLRDIVDRYWVGAWDLVGQSPHTVELLGDPCVHLVVEAGASRVVGVWTRRWTKTLAGRGMVRAVKLHAGALQAVIDGPAHQLTDRIVALDALVPFTAVDEEHVLAPTDDADGVLRLEAWLRAVRRPDAPAEVRRAIELMQTIADDRSLTSVDDLADRAGLGVRGLQRLFREHVGASPKWAIRRHRLQEAAVRIEGGEAIALARLAAELGYADHAHLARDFRAAVGKPPSVFARDVHR